MVDLGSYHLHPDWEEQMMRGVVPAMRDLAERIATDMHLACPVDTGYLQSSIYWHVDEHTGVITAGAHADYAYPVEVGHRVHNSTTYVPAQSFIRSAAHKNLDVRNPEVHL